MNSPTSNTASTHDVSNQPPPLVDYNGWSGDALLREIVQREQGEWIDADARAMGALIGSEHVQTLALLANRYGPELNTHDRFGHRIDRVEFHPAYHELMSLAFGAGLHSLAWLTHRQGRFTARAALNYLWNQAENGTACPVTMTFAVVPVLRNAPTLASVWEPGLTARSYDPRHRPATQKAGTTAGMAMTEKQGGSDLRSNTTRATANSDGTFALVGHKWFCSAPMSDVFLTLAQTGAGITCLLVPRILPDGTSNNLRLQRLKDKIGNRSNASSEIEYQNTLAWPIGEAGRGIATLIEMAHHTRFDIVVAVAGMMRAAFNQAQHHASHREAFGKRLIEQALMQNVLADLAIEMEAATLLAFRLARAFDHMHTDAHERLMTRLITPIAKYWLCKRLTWFVTEAMECLGGNGYVEESPMARLYREAPLNGIWEGSGNVICLDVLRALRKEPGAREALMQELQPAAQGEPRLHRVITHVFAELAANDDMESRARFITEQLAIALQAALMIQHAGAEAADAFCASRLGTDAGRIFGTLPRGIAFAKIIQRASLDTAKH